MAVSSVSRAGTSQPDRVAEVLTPGWGANRNSGFGLSFGFAEPRISCRGLARQGDRFRSCLFGVDCVIRYNYLFGKIGFLVRRSPKAAILDKLKINGICLDFGIYQVIAIYFVGSIDT